MNKRKLKQVIISGDPVSRGIEYGEKAKDLIEKSMEIYRRAFLDGAGVSWDKVTAFANTFISGIRNYDEAIMDEVRGIAKGAGFTPEEILATSLSK